MKTVLDKLSDEKAQKEVRTYTYISLGVAVVTLFVLWWLAVVSVILGPRAFLLTYHKGNKARKDLTTLRIMSAAAVLLGLISLIWGYTN